MSEQPRADPGEHIAVVAALGRLGRHGAWDRLRAGAPLHGLDLVDAELLAAAALVERVAGDRFAVIDPELVDLDGLTLGHAMVAQLRRALEHVDRRAPGWDDATPETVLSQGRASRAAAEHIVHELMPLMPGSRAALEAGSARFLDVGVGVAAISARLCQLYDGLTCVGIDVLADVLRLGASELQGLGLSDRVVLRQQSVADLPDLATFDLAWVPQPFLPRAAFEAGVSRVHRALRPDRWVVVPLASTTASEPFEVAVFAHSAHVLGGGPMSTGEAESLLVGAGFADVRPTSWRSQVLVLARRP